MKKRLQKILFGLVVGTFLAISSGQALAFEFFQNLQWPFYDASVIPAACGSPDLVGSDNAQKAFNFLVSQGLSPEQAAGVLGNLIQESSVVPTKIQGGGDSQNPGDAGKGGYGIAQWTPGSKILDEAKKYNISGNIYELPTQLALVWAEMKGVSPTGVSHMVDGLKQISDPAAAADYFEKNFEGAKDGGNLPQREKNAVDALKLYGGNTKIPPGFTNSCGASTLSPNCQAAVGVAKIICAAKVYDSVSYLEDIPGGHQGAANWHKTCPVVGPSCFLDCSGLVNIAVYDAYGVDARDNTDSERTNTALWKAIPFSQLQPGDLVQPRTSHVEIVDHIAGNTIYVFAAHTSKVPQPQQVGPSTDSDNSGNLYLHYIGPGSTP